MWVFIAPMRLWLYVQWSVNFIVEPSWIVIRWKVLKLQLDCTWSTIKITTTFRQWCCCCCHSSGHFSNNGCPFILVENVLGAICTTYFFHLISNPRIFHVLKICNDLFCFKIDLFEFVRGIGNKLTQSCLIFYKVVICS